MPCEPVKTSPEEMRRSALRRDDLRKFGAPGKFLASRCCGASVRPVELEPWPGIVFLGCCQCGEPVFPVVGRIVAMPTRGSSRFDERMDLVWDDGRVEIEEGSNPRSAEIW